MLLFPVLSNCDPFDFNIHNVNERILKCLSNPFLKDEHGMFSLLNEDSVFGGMLLFFLLLCWQQGRRQGIESPPSKRLLLSASKAQPSSVQSFADARCLGEATSADSKMISGHCAGVPRDGHLISARNAAFGTKSPALHSLPCVARPSWLRDGFAVGWPGQLSTVKKSWAYRRSSTSETP